MTGPAWTDLARRMYRHARFLGAPPEDAEDLVQDALLKLTSDPDRLDPARGSVAGLVRTMVANRWTDRLRRAGTHERARGHLRLVPPSTTPENALVEDGAARLRTEFLLRLTAEERGVFEVWVRQRQGHIDGQQAARELDLNYPEYEAAKKRLRRRCRTVLSELGVTSADLYSQPEEVRHGSA
jgi:DNA-directed RNA polymerase specialized sigma24 family protein